MLKKTQGSVEQHGVRPLLRSQNMIWRERADMISELRWYRGSDLSSSGMEGFVFNLREERA